MVAIDGPLADRLVGELRTDLDPIRGRIGRVRRYLRGEHDLPYMPRGAKTEFKALAQKSVTNWTPLVPDTFSKGLFVDGFRANRSAENIEAWAFWQANGLDARQVIAHRGALEYGVSYVLVLPGTAQARRVPFFRPLSPLRSAAWYQDDDDEFPEIGLRMRGKTLDGTELVELVDSTRVVTLYRLEDGDGFHVSRVDEHDLGVTPFVRFRERLDDESRGIVAPIIPLQDQINEVVFATRIAMQYASFRQKWATGLAIPEDDNGVPVEPFESAVDRLWVSDSPDTHFGDFAQTELSGHHAAYIDTVRTLAAISQISPSILTGDLNNLNAEALAQLDATTTRKLGEYETNFGESWESGFRLAGRAARAPIDDVTAQVRWRDTEARSMAATVDALGKMAQMLAVPVEALWERVPGVTDQDVQHWRALRESADVLGALVGDFQRQTATTVAAPVAQAA